MRKNVKKKKTVKKEPMANDNLLQQMKEALEMLKLENKELQEELFFLKTSPLEYATVIMTGNTKKLPTPDKKSDFKNGVKVRIKPENLDNYNVVYPAGTIVKVAGEKAVLRMLSGNNEEVSIAHLQLQVRNEEDFATVTISAPGGLKEVLDVEALKLKTGDPILVRQSGIIVDKAPHKLYGDTAKVKEVLADGMCDIGEEGKIRPIYVGAFKVEKGDTVVLDHTNHIIVENRKQDQSEFNVDTNTISVKWSEIGGLEDIKISVREMIELPRLNPGIYKGYGKKMTKGILLYGPPGCGGIKISLN